MVEPRATRRPLPWAVGMLAALMACGGQPGAARAEWPLYGHDLANSRSAGTDSARQVPVGGPVRLLLEGVREQLDELAHSAASRVPPRAPRRDTGSSSRRSARYGS